MLGNFEVFHWKFWKLKKINRIAIAMFLQDATMRWLVTLVNHFLNCPSTTKMAMATIFVDMEYFIELARGNNCSWFMFTYLILKKWFRIVTKSNYLLTKAWGLKRNFCKLQTTKTLYDQACGFVWFNDKKIARIEEL